MPYRGTCFRFYTQMLYKKKHLHIEFIVTSHNSVYFKPIFQFILKSRAVTIGNNLYTNQRNVGLKSRGVSNQARVIMARIQYSLKSIVSSIFTM